MEIPRNYFEYSLSPSGFVVTVVGSHAHSSYPGHRSLYGAPEEVMLDQMQNSHDCKGTVGQQWGTLTSIYSKSGTAVSEMLQWRS